MFLSLAIFCCLELVQDSFTDYLLCVLLDECVAGHNKRITHENRYTISCDSHHREARPLRYSDYSDVLAPLDSTPAVNSDCAEVLASVIYYIDSLSKLSYTNFPLC